MTTNDIDQPDFSIITICKDDPQGLELTKTSLTYQSYKNFEWIVIDGSHADKAKKQDPFPDHWQWISEQDEGPYDGMNKGLKQAKGRFVLFLNAGDYLTQPHILALIAAQINDDTAMIYGDSFQKSQNGTHHLKRAKSPHYVDALFTHHQSIFYNRDLIGSLTYDTNYKIAADYLFTQMMLKKDADVIYIKTPISIFSDGGLSQRYAQLGRYELSCIRKNLKLCSHLHDNVIVLKQRIANTLKRHAPAIYWLLRRSKTARA